MFVLVFLQELLLILFGQLILSVDYLREPMGVLVVAAALGLWVSTMGLFIGTIARSEDPVILFSLVAMFLFASLGGTWIPLAVAESTFSEIGHLTLSACAVDRFQNILIRGLGRIPRAARGDPDRPRNGGLDPCRLAIQFEREPVD